MPHANLRLAVVAAALAMLALVLVANRPGIPDATVTRSLYVVNDHGDTVAAIVPTPKGDGALLKLTSVNGSTVGAFAVGNNGGHMSIDAADGGWSATVIKTGPHMRIQDADDNDVSFFIVRDGEDKGRAVAVESRGDWYRHSYLADGEAEYVP